MALHHRLRVVKKTSLKEHIILLGARKGVTEKPENFWRTLVSVDPIDTRIVRFKMRYLRV